MVYIVLTCWLLLVDYWLYPHPPEYYPLFSSLVIMPAVVFILLTCCIPSFLCGSCNSIAWVVMSAGLTAVILGIFYSYNLPVHHHPQQMMGELM